MLSGLQLESIVYACQRHEQLLPRGVRCGFFIGDGEPTPHSTHSIMDPQTFQSMAAETQSISCSNALPDAPHNALPELLLLRRAACALF